MTAPGAASSMVTFLACAELSDTVKVNIELPFPSIPSGEVLKEEMTKVFTYELWLLKREDRQTGTALGGGGRLSQQQFGVEGTGKSSLNEQPIFEIESVTIYDDTLMQWVEFESQRQLHAYDQLYVFGAGIPPAQSGAETGLPPPRASRFYTEPSAQHTVADALQSFRRQSGRETGVLAVGGPREAPWSSRNAEMIMTVNNGPDGVNRNVLMSTPSTIQQSCATPASYLPNQLQPTGTTGSGSGPYRTVSPMGSGGGVPTQERDSRSPGASSQHPGGTALPLPVATTPLGTLRPPSDYSTPGGIGTLSPRTGAPPAPLPTPELQYIFQVALATADAARAKEGGAAGTTPSPAFLTADGFRLFFQSLGLHHQLDRAEFDAMFHFYAQPQHPSPATATTTTAPPAAASRAQGVMEWQQFLAWAGAHPRTIRVISSRLKDTEELDAQRRQCAALQVELNQMSDRRRQLEIELAQLSDREQSAFREMKTKENDVKELEGQLTKGPLFHDELNVVQKEVQVANRKAAILLDEQEFEASVFQQFENKQQALRQNNNSLRSGQQQLPVGGSGDSYHHYQQQQQQQQQQRHQYE